MRRACIATWRAANALPVGSLPTGVLLLNRRRGFAGNNVEGEVRGYKPMHTLGDTALTSDQVQEEVWYRLSMADKLVTNCPLYGSMWIHQILTEAREHLATIERFAPVHGVAEDTDVHGAVFLTPLGVSVVWCCRLQPLLSSRAVSPKSWARRSGTGAESSAYNE
jgi:hypothetical protein